MSSRKKHILATMQLEPPNKTINLPSGSYEIAIRKTWIENGNLKMEAIVVRELTDDKA